MTSLVAQTVKRLSAMWETWVRSLGWEVPWKKKRQPTPVLLPSKSHGRRSLVSMGSQRVGHDWVASLSLLPYINMNPPQVYTCSPYWTLLPPPSPYHPSGSSQCTSPKHPVSCIEPGLVTHFMYDIIHVSLPFSQIIPPSPSPTESKRLFYMEISIVFLLCILFISTLIFYHVLPSAIFRPTLLSFSQFLKVESG